MDYDIRDIFDTAISNALQRMGIRTMNELKEHYENTPFPGHHYYDWHLIGKKRYDIIRNYFDSLRLAQ